MKNLGSDDIYEVRKMALLSHDDLPTLIDFYLPLIGASALSVYLALGEEDARAKSHGPLLARLSLTPGQFENAMEALEAMALVRTYYREEGETHSFLYCVYAPEDPEGFLSDVLLSGTLKKAIGSASFAALVKKYSREEKLPEGYQEVSESFTAFFSPNYDDPVFQESREDNLLGKNSAKLKTSFDYRAFADSLSQKGVSPQLLSSKELNHIERLSALYSLSSEDMADFVFGAYSGFKKMGSRVDFALLEKRCRDSLSFPYLRQQDASVKSEVSGDGVYANLIRCMDNVNPIAFLGYLQKGHKPSTSDMKLVNHLAVDLGLSDPVINALLFFTLQNNDNILSYGYTDKVGAALQRQGCQTSRDALDYLSAIRDKAKARKQAKTFVSKKPSESFMDTPVPPEESPKENEPEVTDEDVDKALAELYGSSK